MYEFLGLPGDLLRPSITPSIIVWCNSVLWRKMCPIISHHHRFMTYIIDFISLTWARTSSFVTLSSQLIYSILLQHHISKASKYLFSVSFITQVSKPYKAKLHIKVFINDFSVLLLIFFKTKILFFLMKF